MSSYDPNRLTRDIVTIGVITFGAFLLLILLMSVTAVRT